VSWQIVPRILAEILRDADESKSQRAMTAMLKMKKLDINELKRATVA
jgi:predicted 3-demethylubiquinone-9 3-methyltransferase (glyoxalase superfamily)